MPENGTNRPFRRLIIMCPCGTGNLISMESNIMSKYSTIAMAFLGFTALTQPAFAQTDPNVDPACVLKNTDGSETIDKVKCPDGMKPSVSGSAGDTMPADGTATTQPDTETATGTATPPAPDAATPPATDSAATQDQTTSPETTGSTSAPAETAGSSIIVAPDALANTKVMTASDFIGKRVYTKAGEDIGEVNDLIVTDTGSVQAVILGVGGFLGIGEKDVAVTMQAIEMQQDDTGMKLVVDASKDQLTSAPGYDRTTRTYIN